MRNLAQIIRELQEAKGRGEIFDPRRLSEKIEVLKPSIELSALRLNIFAEIMDSVGNSWDESLGGCCYFGTDTSTAECLKVTKTKSSRNGFTINVTLRAASCFVKNGFNDCET
jgi:hypothetical protein